jgi:hypothetical protein
LIVPSHTLFERVFDTMSIPVRKLMNCGHCGGSRQYACDERVVI